MERPAPKAHFLVFCTIFLALVVLLGLGTWLAHEDLARREAAAGDGPRSEHASPPASVQRFADPPPSPEQ